MMMMRMMMMLMMMMMVLASSTRDREDPVFPEHVRDSLVEGGHHVKKAVKYAMNRTVKVLSGSKSGASVDEASSGLDSMVAEALTTREEGRERIFSDIDDLKNALKDSEESNRVQSETLDNVDDMLKKIKEDLEVVPLTSEERAYQNELESHVETYMSRGGEYGHAEEQVEDDLKDLNNDAHDAAKERTRQGDRLNELDGELERVETEIKKLRPDLREISLRRSGEGLTFDERSGDEMSELSSSDLIERGRPFAFLEEEEVSEEDGDEFKLDLTSFDRPLLDPTFFDDVDSADLEFATGLATGSTGMTGSATGVSENLEEEEEDEDDAGPIQEEETEDEEETEENEREEDPSAVEKARVWELLTARRYRDAVALAATDAVACHDTAVKFKSKANVLRNEALNTRKRCAVLDEEVKQQIVLTSDAKIYSKAEGENLEQIDGRYSKFVSIVGENTTSERHKTVLSVLAMARDEAIASSKDAEREFDEANEKLESLKKKQSECWNRAKTLATMSRESHHHMLQLDLTAAQALYTYSEAMKSFYEDEVRADEAHVLEIAREAAVLLGTQYVEFEENEDTMMTGSTGSSSSEFDLSNLEDVPVPIGRWVPGPDASLPTDLPEPTFSSTGSASDTEAANVASRAVELLKWESTRQNNLKKSLFVLSNAVSAASASRLAKAEEIAAEQESEEESSEEQTRELADLVVEENRKLADYDLAEAQVDREANVVRTLRALVEEKLGLLESRHRVAKANRAEADAFEKIENERAMSANAVTRAVRPGTSGDLPPVPEILPSSSSSSSSSSDQDTTTTPEAKEEETSSSGKQLADVGDLLKASVAESMGYPSLIEESEMSEEKYNHYKAYIQQTHRINEKALHDGSDSLYVPDLNQVDPSDAMSVAQHVASVASARSKHSSLAATEAAKVAKIHERAMQRMDTTRVLGADAFTIADMKAKIAEASVGIPKGGATGLAWQGLGFPGSPPDIWNRGDPRSRKTTHLIEDVKEMGPLDYGTTGAEDEDDEIENDFGVFGPTGSKADLLMDSIREIRHHFEVISVRAKQYRAEADRLRKRREVSKNDARSTRWESEVASSAMKQVTAEDDRNTWWAEHAEKSAEDAERWYAENEEAKEEKKLQKALTKEAKLLDKENEALGTHLRGTS